MITLIYELENHSKVFESQISDSSGLEGIECIRIEGKDLAKEYNLALKKAKYDMVVFLRKDVRICTRDWGRRVVDVFSTTSYGIIGTLGSLIVPMSGMLWEKEEPLCGCIWYEHYTDECKNLFGEAFHGKILDVVCLEGSFFAVHKQRIAEYFDERYKGDSYFENDFCIDNYQKGVKVGVFYGIDILKDGYDEQDEDFIENHKKFLQKRVDLPYRIIPKLIVDKEQVQMDTAPSVHVIIPNKGQVEELKICLKSLEEQTDYDNYMVTIADYGSTKEEMDAILDFVKDKENVEFVASKLPHPTYIYNDEASRSGAELVLFMSKHLCLKNDILSLMVSTYLANRKECGTIGIRTHQKNHMVRQFGLQLTSFEGDEGMELGLNLKGFGKSYAFRNETLKGVMGNSIECLMIERDLFLELGGLNTNYMHSLADFELNLKAILHGRKNLLVGNAVGIYMAFEKPKFLPKDYLLLMDYINKNIDSIVPYVNLISA